MKKMLFKIDNPEHSEKVQKALFKLGCDWRGGGATVLYTDRETIWVEVTGEMLVSDFLYAKKHCEDYAWTTLQQLEDMLMFVPEVIPENVQEDKINPKQAHGLASLPLNLFSPIGTAYGCVGKLNGMLKYGLSNYLGTEVILSIYVDAIRRHLDKIMAGEEYDVADGVPHFGAILANVDIILCARAAGTLVDDRPLLKGYQDEIAALTKIAQNLHVLHKDKAPKHYYLQELE